MLTMTRSVGCARFAGVGRRAWVATGVFGPTGLMLAWPAACEAQARTETATPPMRRTAACEDRVTGANGIS
jgi:hypothetical protein